VSGQTLRGDITEGRSHYDQALALYDPAEHRSLAMRFAQDIRMAILSYRSQALWLLGYPEAALADTKDALSDAHEIGQAATLMYALNMAALTVIFWETTLQQRSTQKSLWFWGMKGPRRNGRRAE
jgi:hypothetical protein